MQLADVIRSFSPYKMKQHLFQFCCVTDCKVQWFPFQADHLSWYLCLWQRWSFTNSTEQRVLGDILGQSKITLCHFVILSESLWKFCLPLSWLSSSCRPGPQTLKPPARQQIERDTWALSQRWNDMNKKRLNYTNSTATVQQSKVNFPIVSYISGQWTDNKRF